MAATLRTARSSIPVNCQPKTRCFFETHCKRGGGVPVFSRVYGSMKLLFVCLFVCVYVGMIACLSTCLLACLFVCFCLSNVFCCFDQLCFMRHLLFNHVSFLLQSNPGEFRLPAARVTQFYIFRGGQVSVFQLQVTSEFSSGRTRVYLRGTSATASDVCLFDLWKVWKPRGGSLVNADLQFVCSQ